MKEKFTDSRSAVVDYLAHCAAFVLDGICIKIRKDLHVRGEITCSLGAGKFGSNPINGVRDEPNHNPDSVGGRAQPPRSNSSMRSVILAGHGPRVGCAFLDCRHSSDLIQCCELGNPTGINHPGDYSLRLPITDRQYVYTHTAHGSSRRLNVTNEVDINPNQTIV
jgi:hypothetical protein